MKLSSAVVFALSTSVLAYKEKRQFHPPGPGDVRSPCPLLDSLANHDILPHNGKDYTIPMLKKAFKEYINVGPDVAVAVGGMGVAIGNKGSKSFNLNELDLHDAIEHDGSVSRDDAYFGNDHTFNRTIFNEAAQYFEGDTISTQDAAYARLTRHKISKATNPAYHLSKAHRMGSFTEQAFYLSIFGSPSTGLVKDSRYVKYWFRNRRLPYEIGWTPRKHETNLTTLEGLAKKIHAQTPRENDEDFEFFAH